MEWKIINCVDANIMPAGSGSKPESIHSNFVLAGQYEGSEWVSVAGEGAIDENTCSHSYMFSY